MRSAMSALARSRRLGRTSATSIERDTSSATTTLRLRASIFWDECPHCGRAAASATSVRPTTISGICSRANGLAAVGNRRPASDGATIFSRRRSARARRKIQNAPATGTNATSVNIHG